MGILDKSDKNSLVCIDNICKGCSVINAHSILLTYLECLTSKTQNILISTYLTNVKQTFLSEI